MEYEETDQLNRILLDDEEKKEIDVITKFLKETCGCKKLSGKACSTAFTIDECLSMRAECRKLNFYDETHINKLDIAILAEIRALKCTSSLTKRSKHKKTVRQRQRCNFLVNSQVACETMFYFAHAISRHRYQRLSHIFKTEGLVAKPHGNTFLKPKHALETCVEKKVVTFIQNYATQHAICLPERWSTQYNMPVRLLPTSITRKMVFDLYVETCKDQGERLVSLVSFRRIWRRSCSEIIIMTSKTDLCKLCKKRFTPFAREAQFPETEYGKRQFITDIETHLDVVKKERSHCQGQIEQTREAFPSFEDAACREQSKGHCNEQQHYLYSTIQEFCSSELTAKNIFCPKPTIPCPSPKKGRPKH